MPENNLQPGAVDGLKVLKGSTTFLSVPNMNSASHQITLDFNGVVTIPTPVAGQNGVNMSATNTGIALVTLYDATNKLEAQFEVEVLTSLPPGYAAVAKYSPKFTPRVNKPTLELVTQQPVWNAATSKWQYVFKLKPSPQDNMQVTHYGALYDLHKEEATGDGELTGWQPLSVSELSNGLYLTAEFAPGAAPVTIVGAMSISIPTGTKKSKPSSAVLAPVNGQAMPPTPVFYTLVPPAQIKPFSSAKFTATGLTPGALYRLRTAAGVDVCAPALAALDGTAAFQVLWPFNPDNIATATSMTFGLYDAQGTQLLAPAAFTSNTAWAGVTGLSVGRIGTSAVSVQANMDTNLPQVHIDLIKQDGSKDYINEPDPTIAAASSTTVAINEQLPGGTTLLVRLTSKPVDGHPVVEDAAHSILQPIVLEKLAVALPAAPATTNATGTAGSTVGPRAATEVLGQHAWMAADKNAGTQWASTPTLVDADAWWEYEFPAAKTIAAIKIKDYGFSQRFLIQGSNDGVAYTTLRQPADQANWADFANVNFGERVFTIPQANRAAYKIIRMQHVMDGDQYNLGSPRQKAMREVTFYEDGFDAVTPFGIKAWMQGHLLGGGFWSVPEGGSLTLVKGAGVQVLATTARGHLYYTLNGSDPTNPASARAYSGPDQAAIGFGGQIDDDLTVRWALTPLVGDDLTPVTGTFTFTKDEANWVDFEALAPVPAGTYGGGSLVVPMVTSWGTGYGFGGHYTLDGSDPKNISNVNRFDIPATGLSLGVGTHGLKFYFFYHKINPANPNSAIMVTSATVSITYVVTA